MGGELSRRVNALARAFGLTATARTWVEPTYVDGRRCWVLKGCLEGDRPLPRTGAARTIREALDAAEGWLVPELEGVA